MLACDRCGMANIPETSSTDPHKQLVSRWYLTAYAEGAEPEVAEQGELCKRCYDKLMRVIRRAVATTVGKVGPNGYHHEGPAA